MWKKIKAWIHKQIKIIIKQHPQTENEREKMSLNQIENDKNKTK